MPNDPLYGQRGTNERACVAEFVIEIAFLFYNFIFKSSAHSVAPSDVSEGKLRERMREVVDYARKQGHAGVI